jgi:hypothetical protein
MGLPGPLPPADAGGRGPFGEKAFRAAMLVARVPAAALPEGAGHGHAH